MAQTELLVVDDWEKASALLDPARRRVLEHLIEPDSATGVARALRLPRQRVGYHVRELERQGLLETVEERKRGNCIERVLRATARKFIISPAALGPLAADAGSAQDRFSSDYLIATAAQTIRDVAALREGALAAQKQLATLTMELDIRFETAAARTEFADELAVFLVSAARKYHEPEAAEGRTYHFTVGGYPAPAPARKSP